MSELPNGLPPSAACGEARPTWSARMKSRDSRPLVLMVVLALGSSVLLRPAGAGASSLPSTRTYVGSVGAGTGSYVHASGRLSISLALTQTGQVLDPSYGPRPKYAVTITLHGAKCRSTRRHVHSRRACLSLTGTLSGEALTEPDIIGDDPTVIRVTASSGRLAGLGVVKATGTFKGTGFVPRGNRSLRLSVQATRGSVFVSAEGPTVPGFTSP